MRRIVRKRLLFIGTGVPVSTTTIGCFAEVREAREKLLRAAGAANLTIHTFDAALLQSLGYSASQRDAPSDADAGSRSTNLVRQNDLAFYPGETGGRAIKNTNAPWEPMSAVFAETESYYVLGFAPASQTDGAYHIISVEVNLRGVEVHPRKGYYSPSTPTAAPAPLPDAPPATLSAALQNMWPETKIPIRPRLPIRTRRRGTVQESRETIFEKGKGSHGADYQFELPLASLPPGQYPLTIEATRKPKQTVRRSLIFSVR